MNGDNVNEIGTKINFSGEERGYDFISVYFHTIDEKGRIAIPLSFRLALPQESKDKLFISPGLSKTIFCYPTPEWKRFRNCVLSFLSHFEESERKILWWISLNTYEVFLDNQGRIFLPEELRKWANLSKVGVIFGAAWYLVICNEEKFEEIKKHGENNFEGFIKKLYEDGKIR
ncbi:MAG: hypothetical protein N2323_02065 [candidate division WOR-3 bacterium]|nr:hypothetical protein [candidate division WOR-3 bacterium]MCX7836733.1 hypothetical protein [candidate division WOR-3 bacterium]MDW8113368.1 hypothetical protein [candidate division WOR-3 bacterium]